MSGLIGLLYDDRTNAALSPKNSKNVPNTPATRSLDDVRHIQVAKDKFINRMDEDECSRKGHSTWGLSRKCIVTLSGLCIVYLYSWTHSAMGWLNILFLVIPPHSTISQPCWHGLAVHCPVFHMHNLFIYGQRQTKLECTLSCFQPPPGTITVFWGVNIIFANTYVSWK